MTGEGASLFKGNQYNFTDPAVIKAIDKFRTAVKSAPKGTSSEQARQLFIDGKIAMIRDGPWVAAQMKKAPEATRANLKMGMMPFASDSRRHQQLAAHAGQARSGEEEARLGIHQDDDHARMAGEVHAAHLVAGAAQERAVGGRDGGASGSRADQQVGGGSRQPVSGEHPVRENYNEFAKIFVESGMKLMTSDRPTADIMKDLQAEMNKRVPPSDAPSPQPPPAARRVALPDSVE